MVYYRKFRNSVQDTRVMRSADIGVDHYPRESRNQTRMTVTLKAKDDNKSIHYDTEKLKQAEIIAGR